MRLIETNPSAPIQIALGKGKVIANLMLLKSEIVTKTYS